ncbi:DUF3280 domain-containing protein [Aurantimonas sp. C2-6-R+9]|uniref:DUF3280 domain-containing protein n=1 Tax=unclassified Aurantimonas TaxID=2638230 RepID=UPI002E18E848|nr:MULTISPECIES: DUF3280 domain-containing protein [unclassified Aurantimonas]MEC5290306.1 DUF3280 domain-containing protein [Aurantimonas sp. C2-3-R2]MEC5379862.1 DUF3280 domain-containing protein [Aurantimonas sp. C2-6-R+9]MEC5411437.1 DUF3280 domain-containing protein [Aurantimonas sp. C2-4-R8]
MCYGPRIPRQARLFPVVLALLLAAPAFAAEKTVAVFDFELIDSSLEGSMIGQNPDEQARLETMAPALRGNIDTLAGYASVDIAPVRDKALAQNLESCGNCALSFAKTLGADIAVTGTVQKVSNLILNINAYAFDVKTGQPIARGSADIRSNTDESWRRGVAYLWKNVLKKQFEAAP